MEWIKKAMVEKVPLLNIHLTLVAPSRFPEIAKWKLLEASEEVEEPEYVDPTLVAPSEARYRKNYIDLNDKNEKNEKRTILVKKTKLRTKIWTRKIWCRSITINTIKQYKQYKEYKEYKETEHNETKRRQKSIWKIAHWKIDTKLKIYSKTQIGWEFSSCTLVTGIHPWAYEEGRLKKCLHQQMVPVYQYESTTGLCWWWKSWWIAI